MGDGWDQIRNANITRVSGDKSITATSDFDISPSHVFFQEGKGNGRKVLLIETR